MSGFVKLYRGWQNSDMFDNAAAYCERAAWLWLITNAAWKDTTRRNGKGETIAIQRGQIHVSLSALANTWGWSIKRVRTFLKMLEKGHAVGTIKGTSGTVITICNYDKYQDTPEQSGTSRGTGKGTIGAQSGHTQEEGKERKETKNTSPPQKRVAGDYAFQGKVIKVNQEQFDQWRKTFSAIPDLRAELAGLDGWYQGQPDDVQSKWFFRVPSNLSTKHQKLATELAATDARGGFSDHGPC